MPVGGLFDVADYLKARNERDYVLFMFGIYTGLRISDILKFRVRDVKDKDVNAFPDFVHKKFTKNSHKKIHLF
mgnify:CR=1 FL=1